MIGILLAASLVWFLTDFRLNDFKIPFGGPLLHFEPWLSYLLTVIWIVAITNAVNLIDGLDGFGEWGLYYFPSNNGDCVLFLSSSSKSLLDHDHFVLVAAIAGFFPLTTIQPFSIWETPVPCLSDS